MVATAEKTPVNGKAKASANRPAASKGSDMAKSATPDRKSVV